MDVKEAPVGVRVGRLSLIPSPHQLQDVAARYLTIFMELGLYSFSFTPMTNIGASGEGAEMTTREAPASMWL